MFYFFSASHLAVPVPEIALAGSRCKSFALAHQRLTPLLSLASKQKHPPVKHPAWQKQASHLTKAGETLTRYTKRSGNNN
jgi:hypothetical protein